MYVTNIMWQQFLILNQNILDHAKEHFALVGDGDFKRIGEDSYYANDNSF